MASSFSNLVNNISEGIHRINCKFGHDDKKSEKCGIKYKYCDCFLQYTDFKDDLIECKCLCCNKNYQQKFYEKLKERLCNTNFRTTTIISLLLQKGVYPHEYVHDWENFNEILPEKDFYSHLNVEDITDADYVHAKRVCIDFEIKILGEYHDLYVQSDALLSTDVFENLKSMCLEIYEFDAAKFLSAPGLAWQAALKKTKAKLDLLTDINMLLMVEKGIGGCHCIYRYADNNTYMKDFDQNKESSYIQYWDVNNLCGWAMLQRLSLNNFEWIKDISQFNEDFIKNYNLKNVIKDIVLKLMLNILKNYMTFTMIYHF